MEQQLNAAEDAAIERILEVGPSGSFSDEEKDYLRSAYKKIDVRNFSELALAWLLSTKASS